MVTNYGMAEYIGEVNCGRRCSWCGATFKPGDESKPVDPPRRRAHPVCDDKATAFIRTVSQAQSDRERMLAEVREWTVSHPDPFADADFGKVFP